MDLATLRSAVRTRLGVPASDPIFTDGALTELVNSANHYLETEWDWPWLETTEDIATVIGTATYTPGATWMRTIDLRVANGALLRRVPIDELDFLSSAGTGEPRLFCVTGGQLTVFPTPSAVLTLKHRYVRSEPDLVNAGDTPLVPLSFRSAIVEYASFLALRRSRDEGRAEVARSGYKEWLEQMVKRTARYADTAGGGAEYAPSAKATPAAR